VPDEQHRARKWLTSANRKPGARHRSELATRRVLCQGSESGHVIIRGSQPRRGCADVGWKL